MNGIENSANPKVQKANRRSQFFELLALLSLVFIICGAVLIGARLQFWLWTIIWSTALVFSLQRAIRHQILALSAYRKARFNFSAERLYTLEVLETPEDVMIRLRTLRGRRILGEGKLFETLNRLMGRERCAEISATVFKYTKVD